MKNISLLAIVALLCACGSDGGSDPAPANTQTSSSAQNENCVVMMSTIALSSGESCTLTQEDADMFSVSAGEISCNAGTITYNGSTFSSGSNNVTFNGLSISCS